jgi:hypothetical protein
MGALRDAIIAIITDPDLSEDEKKAAIRRAKCRAILDALAGQVPFTIQPVGYVITVTAMSEVDGNLVSTLEATRLGVPVVLSNPFIYVNPPLMIEDPQGDVTRSFTDRNGVVHTVNYREAPLLAYRLLVIESVRDAWRASQQ